MHMRCLQNIERRHGKILWSGWSNRFISVNYSASGIVAPVSLSKVHINGIGRLSFLAFKKLSVFYLLDVAKGMVAGVMNVPLSKSLNSPWTQAGRSQDVGCMGSGELGVGPLPPGFVRVG